MVATAAITEPRTTPARRAIFIAVSTRRKGIRKTGAVSARLDQYKGIGKRAQSSPEIS